MAGLLDAVSFQVRLAAQPLVQAYPQVRMVDLYSLSAVRLGQRTGIDHQPRFTGKLPSRKQPVICGTVHSPESSCDDVNETHLSRDVKPLVGHSATLFLVGPIVLYVLSPPSGRVMSCP